MIRSRHAASARLITATALLAALTLPTFAGDPNPPSGPITGTMKPLSAIEPRICVNELPGAPNAAHVISAPGSYYLTGDITAGDGQSGILIDLAPGLTDVHVIIDVVGHSISGTSASIDGIRAIEPPASTVAVVIIGALTTLGGNLNTSFHGLGQDAIHIENAASVQLSNLGIRNCAGDGVDVRAKKLFVGNLSVAECAGHGFTIVDDERVELVFSHCDASGNGGHGFHRAPLPGAVHHASISFQRCSALSNTLDGINLTASEGTSEIDIDECSASNNLGRGLNVRADDNTSCWMRVSRSRANNNGHTGMGVSLGVTADASLRYDGCETSSNGQGGDLSDGGGGDTTTDPGGAGGGGRVTVEYNDHTSFDNLTYGAIMKSQHDTLKAIISNMKASYNGDSGLDADNFDLTVRNSLLANNGGSGLRVSDTSVLSVEDTALSSNAVNGLSVESGPACATTAHLRNSTADNNAGDGFAIFCATSGRVIECSANANTGAGFRVGDGPFGLATHLMIDRCLAAANGEGFAIADIENYFVRCAAMGNLTANMTINPANAFGPSTPGAWDEVKPYCWP